MYSDNKNSSPVDLADFIDRFPNKKSIKRLLDDFSEGYPDLINELINSIENGTPAMIKDSTHKLKGVLINLSIMRGYTLTLDLEKKSAEIQKTDALARVAEISEELQKIKGFLAENESYFRS
jgi:hypothetical protein